MGTGPDGWRDLGSRPRLTLSLACLGQSSHLGSGPRGGRLARRPAPEPPSTGSRLAGRLGIGAPREMGGRHGESHGHWASLPL